MKKYLLIFFMLFMFLSTAHAGPENKWYVFPLENTDLIMAFEETTVRMATKDTEVTFPYEYLYGYVVINGIRCFVLANDDRDLIYIQPDVPVFRVLLEVLK